MKRLPAIFAGLATGFLLFADNAAYAIPPANTANRRTVQSRYTPSRPTVSPYLGLSSAFRATTGYYTVVRPVIDQEVTNLRHSTEIHDLGRELQRGVTPVHSGSDVQSIRPTGHPAWFMTHHRYFGGLGR